jgi:hypothetical protein
MSQNIHSSAFSSLEIPNIFQSSSSPVNMAANIANGYLILIQCMTFPCRRSASFGLYAPNKFRRFRPSVVFICNSFPCSIPAASDAIAKGWTAAVYKIDLPAFFPLQKAPFAPFYKLFPLFLI